ncbi:GAF and ANTAR domain-containing protein [Nocardioides sp. Arc9.136]|uniref:GAF and ANTAR domain-containing protein n=1 Tax=Nocardioides sp. Arc9.136 TaxID=2996826 RepID=UPI002666C7EE|nr:GAF and ANTAR domain-containing protein [Nocardioides sp. Arc9.136]WKN49003.1 GAF and ANTAR domain-containing protein [Nocardioides sp. Arc9.136]
MPSMEPIPETRRAIDELDADLEGTDTDLLDRLLAAAAEVRRVVPDCLGLSLGYLREGVVLTLVASDVDVAVLDAVQYLAGGPCVDAAAAESVLEEQHADLFDEDRWQLFARTSAAKAVRSTLTLPIVEAGEVVGTVNLYGASSHAFTGHHEELAEVFGAWAPGAVTNADLSFSTRAEARRAPQRLADQRLVDTAVGIVSEQLGVDVDAARGRLSEAASRAGVELTDLAEAVLESALRRAEPGPDGEPED